MAVAAPARRSAPARGAAPPRKLAPARKATPARATTARGAPARARAVPNARVAAPALPRPRPAPARAPRRRPATAKRRAAGGQLIPLAVGRTAVAVRGIPDSSLMVRMTRGRAWIAVVGILLVGIVALNVVTLSLAASAGRIDRDIQALDQENGLLRNRDARRSGIARVRHDAAALGLVVPTAGEIHRVEAGPGDVEVAARRLAGAN